MVENRHREPSEQQKLFVFFLGFTYTDFAEYPAKLKAGCRIFGQPRGVPGYPSIFFTEKYIIKKFIFCSQQ